MPTLRAEGQLTTVGPAAAFQAKTGKEACSGANPVLVKVGPWAPAPQADVGRAVFAQLQTLIFTTRCFRYLRQRLVIRLSIRRNITMRYTGF